MVSPRRLTVKTAHTFDTAQGKSALPAIGNAEPMRYNSGGTERKHDAL